MSGEDEHGEGEDNEEEEEEQQRGRERRGTAGGLSGGEDETGSGSAMNKGAGEVCAEAKSLHASAIAFRESIYL